MVYNPNANWTAATASQTKRPVWVVRFDGDASTQYSTGPVKSASRTTKQYLEATPQGLSQRVDPATGKYDVGLITFQLLDVNSEITDLFASLKSGATLPTLQNRVVDVLIGYADLDEADYASVPGGVINDCQFAAGVWTVKLGDAKRETLEDIFVNADAGSDTTDYVETTLTDTASAGSILLKLSDATNVVADMKLIVGPNSSGEEEVIEVLALKPNNTLAKMPLQFTYSSGDAVRWATTRLRGNPINVLYSILTGSFSTTGSFPLTLADGLPTGLDMDPTMIDTAGMAAERDSWFANVSVAFEEKKSVRAQKFIEEQFLVLFGLLVVTPDGKLGFRAHRPRDGSESVLKITDADVSGAARVRRRFDLAINKLVVRYDYNAFGERFITEKTFEDTTVQSTVGVRLKEVELRGWLSTDGGGGTLSDSYIERFAKQFLERYKFGPTEIKLQTKFTKRVAELGEDCDLDLEDVPNVRIGSRGITHSEIVPAQPGPSYQVTQIDENEEGFDITLMESGYLRQSFIAPASQPDYGSATEAQRRYAYISPPGGANFADGTAPYRIN